MLHPQFTSGLLLGLMIVFASSASRLHAQTTNYYWDGNGTDAGAGVTPDGTWGVDNFWNTSSAGTAGTFTNTVTGSDVVFFSAGTDATGAYTVSVSGTQNVGGIHLDYGNGVTLTNGVLALTRTTTSATLFSINAGSTLGGTATVGSTIQLNTTPGNGALLILNANDGAADVDLRITGAISNTSAANTYSLRLGGAGNGRIETALSGANATHGGVISASTNGWTGTWTIAGDQSLGSTAVNLTANDNKLVMGDGLSDTQSWSGNTSIGGGGASNSVLTVRSTATSGLIRIREGVGNTLQVPGQLTGTTMQFGTNAASTTGTTLRLSDGVTAGSATFTALTVFGSGHKVVGGAAEAGTLNLDLSADTTVGSGLALGGAGANENNFNVVKTGVGTLTLSAANTYTGTTTISAGSLIIGASGSVGSSSVLDVASGATLDVSAVTSGFVVGSGQTLRGSGTIVGDTTIGSGGVLSPGNSTGTLTFNDNLTLDLNSTSAFQIDGFGAGQFDLVQGLGNGQTVTFAGTLNLTFINDFSTEGSVKIFDFENYSGGFNSLNTTGLAEGYSATFDSLSGTVNVVPEPSTYALLALAAAGLGAHVVRRRRSSR